MGNDYNPEMFQIPGNVCQNLRLLNIHLEVTVVAQMCACGPYVLRMQSGS